MDWSPFYTAIAGASATLLGLLFVAVQFNIDAIATERGSRWWVMARSTFYMYVTIFVISMASLIPMMDIRARAAFILLSVAFGIFRAVSSWFPMTHEILHRERTERLWQILWLLLGPLLVYLSLGRSAGLLYQGFSTPGTEEGIAFAIVGLLIIVLRNSWNLLFELSLEKKK